MKVKVVTMCFDEREVVTYIFANDTKILDTVRERLKEFIDEDTEEEQQKALEHINKLTTFEELCEYTYEKFGGDFILDIEEDEVIE